jgi:hypothetical protein
MDVCVTGFLVFLSLPFSSSSFYRSQLIIVCLFVTETDRSMAAAATTTATAATATSAQPVLGCEFSHFISSASLCFLFFSPLTA